MTSYFELEKRIETLEKDFNGDPSKLIEDIGKPVRTMPQIKVDGKLIGGYNQLVEHFADKKQVNFKGEIISEWWWQDYFISNKQD